MFKFPKRRRPPRKEAGAPGGISKSHPAGDDVKRQAFAERIGKAYIAADARRRKARGEKFH